MRGNAKIQNAKFIVQNVSPNFAFCILHFAYLRVHSQIGSVAPPKGIAITVASLPYLSYAKSKAS